MNILPETLSGEKSNPTLLAEVIQAQLANRRQGSASTKTRAEVRGGGNQAVAPERDGPRPCGFDPLPHLARRRNHLRAQAAFLSGPAAGKGADQGGTNSSFGNGCGKSNPSVRLPLRPYSRTQDETGHGVLEPIFQGARRQQTGSHFGKGTHAGAAACLPESTRGQASGCAKSFRAGYCGLRTPACDRRSDQGFGGTTRVTLHFRRCFCLRQKQKMAHFLFRPNVKTFGRNNWESVG